MRANNFGRQLFRRPLFPALICSLLWGSSFPAIKTVFHHWEDKGLLLTLPLGLLFARIRFILAGSGLLAVSKNLRPQLRATSWKLLAILALTQTFLQYLFLYKALAISGSSLTALLVATGSFWWMLLAPLIQKTPWPTPLQWLGLLVGGLGVTLAIYRPGSGASQPILGGFLMLAATASGAIGLITFARIKPTMSAMNATGFSLFTGGLVLILAGAHSLQSIPQMFDLPVILAATWLALVSASAFSMWNHLFTIFPVTLLASYRFLLPICGVIEPLLFLRSESPGWGLLFGGSLVVLSMLLAKRTTVHKATP